MRLERLADLVFFCIDSPPESGGVDCVGFQKAVELMDVEQNALAKFHERYLSHRELVSERAFAQAEIPTCIVDVQEALFDGAFLHLHLHLKKVSEKVTVTMTRHKVLHNTS